MLEDTNSLDGAHTKIKFISIIHPEAADADRLTNIVDHALEAMIIVNEQSDLVQHCWLFILDCPKT